MKSGRSCDTTRPTAAVAVPRGTGLLLAATGVLLADFLLPLVEVDMFVLMESRKRATRDVATSRRRRGVQDARAVVELGWDGEWRGGRTYPWRERSGLLINVECLLCRFHVSVAAVVVVCDNG